MAKVGDIGAEIVFVLRGTVQLWSVQIIEMMGADGIMRRTRVRVVEGYASQGSYFGDLEYFYKSTRLVNYTVFHASEFLTISYGKLKSLLAKYEGACTKMTEECRKRLEVFNETSSSPVIRFADNEGYSRENIWVDGDSESGGSYEEVNKSQAVMPLTYSIITAIDKGTALVSGDDETMKAGRRIHFSELSVNDLWKSYIIHPDSRGKFIWDIYISLLIVFVLFITTTQVSFERCSTLLFYQLSFVML